MLRKPAIRLEIAPIRRIFLISQPGTRAQPSQGMSSLQTRVFSLEYTAIICWETTFPSHRITKGTVHRGPISDLRLRILLQLHIILSMNYKLCHILLIINSFKAINQTRTLWFNSAANNIKWTVLQINKVCWQWQIQILDQINSIIQIGVFPIYRTWCRLLQPTGRLYIPRIPLSHLLNNICLSRILLFNPINNWLSPNRWQGHLWFSPLKMSSRILRQC